LVIHSRKEKAMTKRITIVLCLLLACLIGRGIGGEGRPTEREAFFQALRIVECGDVADPPDGDGGEAIGPYQIHRAYFQDAVDFDESIAHLKYEDCRTDEFKASQVVATYMRRYVPRAWKAEDWQVVARTHNGGPRGAKKSSTLPYWRKVKAEMDRLLEPST